MNRRRASRVRQQLRQTEEARRSHVEVILGSESLVDGSFVTLGRKCGKPTCRCASGDKHFSKFLSRSVEGRTELTYVPSGDEVEVARKAERYRSLRRARAELMKLSAQTATLADSLQQALVDPYPAQAAPRPRRKPTDDGDAER
jgi:hypothetical protein